MDTGNNTVVTTWAFHSGSSDDFNPSLAVGVTPRGETAYINWAFTDTPAGTATSAVVGFGDAIDGRRSTCCPTTQSQQLSAVDLDRARRQPAGGFLQNSLSKILVNLNFASPVNGSPRISDER